MKISADKLQQCWFLAGPTATGKSALSLLLAERLNAEIISMDSMAIYRGMDIGTAKPSVDEQKRVPHHLIDFIEPHQEFSTAEYLSASIQVVDDILSRGRIPLFVGGTGLYLRALLRGVFEGPPADWEFRSKLMEQAAEGPPDWLHSELIKIDPITAGRLHPNDARRLIRALEVYALTGVPPSELHSEEPLPPGQQPRHVYWLHPPRRWLHDRINHRVEVMFERGLIEEVQSLLRAPNPPGQSARQALGYRETIDWLEGRLESEQATIELIQTRTRQFAKRQHTWFRNLTECREIPVTGDESPDELLQRITGSSTSIGERV